jgi:hypothetical protein
MSKLAALIVTPIALAALAAHFGRSGRFVPAAIALSMIGLLLVRRGWAARTLQVALALGAIEWLRTLAVLVAERQSLGSPYLRLAIILGAVAIATALCAVAFETRAMRARYTRANAVTAQANER